MKTWRICFTKNLHWITIAIADISTTAQALNTFAICMICAIFITYACAFHLSDDFITFQMLVPTKDINSVQKCAAFL